jgi:hypothetical protein
MAGRRALLSDSLEHCSQRITIMLATLKSVGAWLVAEWGTLATTVKVGIIAGLIGFALGKLL